MSSLSHHGIKGQKWGVRRFQNKDGTRTSAGKKQEKLRRLKKTTSEDFISIRKTLSDNDLQMLNYDDESIKYMRENGSLDQDPITDITAHRVIQKDRNGTPVAYVEGTGFTADSLLSGKAAARIISIDLATRAGDEYRGKGHAVAAGKKMVKWFDRYGYKNYEYMEWAAKEENIASQKTAEKLGFKKLNIAEPGWTLYAYSKEAKHSFMDNTPYLSHHGIKGQKWGVRRYQNKDGTRTAAGKARDYKKARELKQKAYDHYDKYGPAWRNKPVAAKMYLKAERLEDPSITPNESSAKANAISAQTVIDAVNLAETIRSDPKLSDEDRAFYEDTVEQYMHRAAIYSYISDDIRFNFEEKGKPVTDREKDWNDYVSRQKEYLKKRVKDGDTWLHRYEQYISIPTVKHTSIGGTMYIEGNVLILGDSSYLEHHGIRGQKWGVRRFQNRDGSLTNAGRKRLGYVTKGATQTVKKAFKAGVKTGTKAVKAAKAHHKKVEEKKIEKKKEKASKTRAGVYANKDLFTAKELKELNAKFEEQDKLTMARLKKGVEIAKAVGQYAQTAKQIGDAYQSITGKNILSHITEIKSANEAKAKEEKESADKAKAEAEAAAKKAESKAMAKEALQKNIDAFKADQESNARVKDLEKQGNKTAAKTKLAEYIDRYNQDKAAQEQTKQMMKNQKLQEYIDRANQAQREKDAATLKETTDRGKQVIDVLSKGGGFNFEAPSSSPAPSPKPAPSSNNLMAQIRAAQTKLKKPNKNETPAEHKEAQKKLNALEKVANEYKAAANKPGADPAEITEKLLKKNKDILDDIKHMDFNDTDYLEHYGVRGMKWGKHLMAGKGGGIYDGTALGGGGGGGPMTEEERKKLEALKKKKEEEARKEQETAEKAKEIGVSVEAYKRYSIENNHLPGKSHYTKSNKLHNEASASVAAAQAAERQAHMNKAKAASLSRKVNSSHMFDSEGYHISQQRADDRNEAKRLRKEAKKLSKESRRALKKFYKKRYKADKERQRWQSSTSGKYHHMMRHYEIQNGVLFVDSSDGFAHHGVKGQKWGVRRFQNEDGTLTDKGRKRYEKALSKEKRKQVSSDAIRGTLERQHPFAVAASVALGATYAAMLGVASAAAPGAVVAGAAIAAAISGVGTHGLYSVSEAWEGRGTRMRSKKIAKYESMLKQSDMEEGMYHVENGTLFIDAGEPYLEHHGVLGMKWGKHLRAGKGPADASASAGGGGGEDDEKLKEMAKKAGMSVAEYKQKFASKIGGAASKVGEKIYDAAGGKYKNAAEGWRKDAREELNEAKRKEKNAHEQSAAAQSYKRKNGYGFGYRALKGSADSYKDSAELHKSIAKLNSDKAGSMQSKYEKSLAGRYDKMKADRARKKSSKEKKRLLTQTSAEAKSKRISVKDKHLVINGNRSSGTRSLAVGETGEKSKSFKEKAYNALGGKYKTQATEAHREMVQKRNDAEGSYRRAAALGKQASSSTSTSSRPRARKKKHTSGGSGVTVRRPGRKPVSRTKRVTQSSTGVKRRSATGTGARVRRGA